MGLSPLGLRQSERLPGPAGSCHPEPLAALPSPELSYSSDSKALLIAQSELSAHGFLHPWAACISSDVVCVFTLPKGPGLFTFQIFDSWVNFCFRPKKDSLQFTMAGQWRRGNCRSSCEGGFCKCSGEAAVQLRACPLAAGCILISGLSLSGRRTHLWGWSRWPPPPAPQDPQAFRSGQVRPGDVNAGVDWRFQLQPRHSGPMLALPVLGPQLSRVS